MTKGPNYYDNTGDAKSIQGTNVSATPPTDQQILKYNVVTGQYEPAADNNSGTGGSGGGADPGAQYIVVATTASLANERALTAGSGLTSTDGGANGNFTLGINNNVVATISGSTFTQLSGSLQSIATGASYLVAIGGVAITSQSNGQIFVSASAGLGGPPLGASYLTVGADPTLTAERTLTAGTGLTSTDAGANSSFTLAVNNNVVATISGSLFSGPVATVGGFTGSLLLVSAGNAFMQGTPSITVATQSNGAVSFTAAPALMNLTQAFSHSTLGNGTLSLIHSGATVMAFDSLFRVHTIKNRWQTTNSTIFTGLSFISGANGRSYMMDAALTCQHTSTRECGRWKLSGHALMTGSAMVWVAQDTALSSSNVPALSGTLGFSGANIIVQSTANSGTFNWGCELRVQETGI